MATQLLPQRAPQPQMVTVMGKQIPANVLLGAAAFFFVLSFSEIPCHNNFPCSRIFSQITGYRMGGENAVRMPHTLFGGLRAPWVPYCRF